MGSLGVNSKEIRSLVEVTPKNFDQFFPKVYSDLTLPASALIFVGKEPKQEIFKLEQLRAECEKINLNALIDLRKNASEVTDKYGIDTSLLRERIKQNQILRERYLLNLLKARGYQVEFNEESRVASVQYGDKKLYGSVYSLLDTNPELVSFEPILREFETQDSSDSFEHIMSFFTDEGKAFEVLNSITGSFAQNEINPYPSDFDFNELLQIKSESIEDGIETFRTIVLKNFEKFENNPNSTITKFKMGNFRIEDESGKIQEIKMVWTHEEVLRGSKIVTIDGKELEISFVENVKNLTPDDFIKFSYITNISGVFRECEKLIDLKIINENEEDLFEHTVHRYSPVQEIFFDDPSKFKRVENTIDLNVLYRYNQDMIGGFNKYFNCQDDLENCNPLKATKRAYNLLKLSALIQQGRELSSILDSDLAKLTQVSTTLDLHASILESFSKNNFTETNFFNLDNVKKSFQNFIKELENDESSDISYICKYLKIVLFKLNSPNPNFPMLISILRNFQEKITKNTTGKIYNELLKQKTTLNFLDDINIQLHS